MLKAYDIAKYFIKHGYDCPRNTFDGNMKLNKLLYFSQLVSLALKGEPLFEDEMYAFKNGTVIESVRQKYKNDFNTLIEEAEKSQPLSESVIEVLRITESIFGKLNAKELSELNHQQKSWEIAHERSKGCDDFYDKNDSIIEISSIKEYDISLIKTVVDSFLENKNYKYSSKKVNNKTYYFDSENIELDSNIIHDLFNLDIDDDINFVYKDKDGELVVF